MPETTPPRIHTNSFQSGLIGIAEPIPGVRSAALHWLLPAGSACDPPDKLGIAAVTQEVLLRGAGELDSRAHADAMDRIGAAKSASVGTYHMGVGCTLVGDRLPEALPLLADMVRKPRIDPAAIDASKALALQQIEALADDPRERAVLGARQRHFPEAIGRSGLGTPEGIANIDGSDLSTAWAAHARPRGSIISVAGAIDPDQFFEQLESLLPGWAGDPPELHEGLPGPRGYGHIEDKSNQVQIIVLHDAPREADKDSILERIVLSVLSGGMSARLFTEVREKRGLCYAVSASYAGDRDFGRALAYVGTTPERAQESLDVLLDELRRINSPQGRITQEEFDRAVIGFKSGLVFSGESTSARASALARDQFRLGRPRSLEELAAAIDAVTLSQVNDYLARRALGTLTVQTLGPEPLKPTLE